MSGCAHCGVETHSRGKLHIVDQVSGVYVGDKRIKVAPAPLAILRHLVVYGTLTHEQLTPYGKAGSVKVHIFKLRAKLAPYGVTIKNDWGVGYSLVV